ncbi:MAG: TetR/AcrR family transcriptional regulator [Alphaproteobacteria bacterium]|nr:TetR/AcrR family transcriptional regulator [Alphaproteobacteria bacterium]
MKKTMRRSPSSSSLDDLPERRRAILIAAFSVLMEQGYAGASTLEIATRARVSKRELYAEFGSKRGILEALIASTSARMKVPLEPDEVHDRASLASALTRYGITALGELTQPAVLAVNRLLKAQEAGLLGTGDPDRIGGQFFSLLFGDLILRLLLGVAQPPGAADIHRRAEAATDAVLTLHPPR